MFLKRLVLNGFKSFADFSEINFVKGISAIVGPNGCGKSNIVDSIAWVIGEQKTKSLRANNMVDVIFKGTEEKKGLGRAEVKLTLVNEKGILPIDYNEVEVSRVIYANGENEYLINKKRVRLKDIQELFFDTGVGKSAYSIMAQGKIDMILSNKPEDRRYIIEEAAGITKYKVKRYEALSRLKQTNDNIIRIRDIIDEVKSQYDNMKKQAEKAKKYKEIYEKETALEIELNINRVKKQQDIEKDLENKLNNASKELEEIKSKLDSLEDGVEGHLSDLTNFENKKIENQREIFKIQSDIKILNSKKDILKEQINQYEINIKNDSSRIDIISQNIKDVEAELDNIENNKNELDEKITSLKKDNEFYNNNIKNLDNEIDNTNNEIEELKSEINTLNERLIGKRLEQGDITEKLIVKIDQSLNIFDANSDQIQNFKNKLKENLSYVIENIPKKRAFLDDMIRGGHVTGKSDELLNMLSKLKAELQDLEEKIIEADQNINQYIYTIEEFLNDIFGPEGILQKKRKIEQEIDECSDKINQNSNKIEEKRQEIIKKRDKKEDFVKVLNELKINLTTYEEKKNAIDNDIKRLMSLKSHHENNKDELIQKITFYNNKIRDINSELEDIAEKLNNLYNNMSSLEKDLVDIDKNIREKNLLLSSQQRDIKDINNRWMDKKNHVEKINIRLTEAKTTINNINESFYENYSIDLNNYKGDKYSSDRTYDDIRNELMDIKTRKNELGSVNLMAIEEAKILEDRYNLLIDQLNDLELAKKDIDKMMEKINKTSMELFLSTFEEIKVNFHKVFRKLFDGGNAEITLTNPDNILETGIDIIAHPPGQKTQSITLLSGGQRTMTAIALMFATFLVKPSPFCLLDEIDAALDEENVSRFIKLLNEMKETSQFIIITHNKKTISAADVMYGVTQEQKGISKIVSTKLAEKTS